MEIICIVGLPGSGKTTLAARMRSSESMIIDDPKSLNCLPSFSHCVSHGIKLLVICDPWFCLPGVRQKASVKVEDWYRVKPRWIFFENDPIKAQANVEKRNDGRVVQNLIRTLSPLYHIPSDQPIWPIWQPKEITV
jgi:hypothetical protein